MNAPEPNAKQLEDDRRARKESQLVAKKEKKAERMRLKALQALEDAKHEKRLKLEREQKLTAHTYDKSAESWENMVNSFNDRDLRNDLEVQMQKISFNKL